MARCPQGKGAVQAVVVSSPSVDPIPHRAHQTESLRTEISRSRAAIDLNLRIQSGDRSVLVEEPGKGAALRRLFPMKRTIATLAFLSGIAAIALPAQAALIDFTASLDGAQQVPPAASTGTGSGSVVLDTVADTITVNLSFQGLTGPALAAHIHGPGAVGTNASILFPFMNVPNATSGSIPQQTFSITPSQISDLEAGLYYMNVHTPNFPLGEIRGQLEQVPEPATMALLAAGVLGLSAARRKAR